MVSSYTLAECRNSFVHIGFSKVPGFLGTELVRSVESSVDQVVAKFQSKPSQMEDAVVSYGSSWIFLENIFRYSDYLKRFFMHGPFLDLAKYLLNSDSVQLLRDQTYYKIGPAKETPWHQDGLFVPDDNLSSVTFWLPFHDIDSSMSPMSYVDFSHRWCYLGGMFDRFHDFNSFQSILESQGERTTTFDSLSCGDLLAHHTWAMHGTPAMTANSSRKAIVLVYAKPPIFLDSSPDLLSCHRDLRAQAALIREANKSSYSITSRYYE